MTVALVTARLLLAVLFGAAALTKLADRRHVREALRSFGLSDSLAGPSAVLLPVSELLVAFALLPAASAKWAAMAALALLLTFTTAISYNLARGRKPKCRCFGQLQSKPIGWSTVVRNVGLCAIAGLVAGRGAGMGMFEWIGGLALIQRVEVLVAASLFGLLMFQTVVLAAIIKQQGRILRRLEITEAQFTRAGALRGLTVGTRAPTFSLPNLKGEVVTLDVLRARGLPIVLLFTDPHCGACDALMPKVDEWQRDYGDKITLVSLSHGTAEANLAKAGTYRIGEVLLQQDHEVDDAYKVDGTPTALLVRPDGTIGSPQAGAVDMIVSLVAGTVGELGPSPLLTADTETSNDRATMVA